jgi:hypothetical protein
MLERLLIVPLLVASVLVMTWGPLVYLLRLVSMRAEGLIW